jgi:hypothetical protein
LARWSLPSGQALPSCPADQRADSPAWSPGRRSAVGGDVAAGRHLRAAASSCPALPCPALPGAHAHLVAVPLLNLPLVAGGPALLAPGQEEVVQLPPHAGGKRPSCTPGVGAGGGVSGSAAAVGLLWGRGAGASRAGQATYPHTGASALAAKAGNTAQGGGGAGGPPMVLRSWLRWLVTTGGVPGSLPVQASSQPSPGQQGGGGSSGSGWRSRQQRDAGSEAARAGGLAGILACHPAAGSCPSASAHQGRLRGGRRAGPPGPRENKRQLKAAAAGPTLGARAPPRRQLGLPVQRLQRVPQLATGQRQLRHQVGRHAPAARVAPRPAVRRVQAPAPLTQGAGAHTMPEASKLCKTACAAGPARSSSGGSSRRGRQAGSRLAHLATLARQ